MHTHINCCTLPFQDEIKQLEALQDQLHHRGAVRTVSVTGEGFVKGGWAGDELGGLGMGEAIHEIQNGALARQLISQAAMLLPACECGRGSRMMGEDKE